MNLSIKHLDYTALVLLAMTLVLGLVFIFHAHGSAQKRFQLESQRTLEQGNDLEAAKNNLDYLGGVLAAHQATFEGMKLRIPDSAGIGDLLTLIQEQIDDRNIVLTRFSHQPPVKTSQYQRISLHLSLEGKFPDLYRLIHDFETMGRVFIIESIQITRPENKERCNLELMAEIFQE
ncbi:MAG: type 4a pilus biogenesis protein PilO [Desulfobacula sp.]|jgi:Tfp pilus assembly protein PilO|nr:type 4a pilus biogenesis protein PilO [Desulfobacula sp.]